MTTTIGVRRRTVSLITAAAFASTGAFALATSPSATADNHNQWVYVCKYVGTPGVDERLQTGQNPILVSVNAVGSPVMIGVPFNDAQGRSVVIAFGEPGGGQSGEPEPECPPVITPPTTTTATTTTATTTTTTTTTTTPSTTTKTTKPPKTTRPPHKPPHKPPVNPPAATPPGPGGGVTPGPGAPDTGGGQAVGTNDSVPINGLIGSGLLLAAGGIVTAEAARRRREIAGK